MQELTDTNIKYNYDNILTSIPIFDNSKKDEVFECLERLNATCLQNGRDIYARALGNEEAVSGLLIKYAKGKLWKNSWEELKRCFWISSLEVLLLLNLEIWVRNWAKV